MRQFYLGKNSSGFYRVYFIDPVTGLRDNGKSTHTKDIIEAAAIAGEWLKNGAPSARGNSRAFNSSDVSKVSVDLSQFINRLSESELKLAFDLISQKLNLPKNFIPVTETPVISSESESISENPPAKKKVIVHKKSVAAKPEESKKLLLCDTLENFWDYEKSEFIEKHLAHGHSMSKKHAFCMHAYVRNYWRPYWGDDTLIEDLTKPELDDFFFYLYKEKGLKGETVNKVINSCSRATRWLFDNKRIKENPMLGVERFKSDNLDRGIPTEAEVRKLLELDWDNPMALMAFKLGAFCGLRAGEISGLRVCDVDVAEGIIHVRHSYSEVDGLKSTKNKDKRDLPIDNATALQLMNHARRNPKFSDMSYIFWSSKDPVMPTTPGYYADIFYLALHKIGISEEQRKERNIVFHSLRHFCATILAQRTDMKTVQSIMGHRTEVMTEHYSDHDTREKFNNVRSIMSDAWKQYLSA